MSQSNVEIETAFQDKVAAILTALGLSATIIVDTVEVEDRKYLKVDLEGEELGTLIGYHGKTLEALRQVLILMAPQTEDSNTFGILLDVNGYYAKREEYVRDLAFKVIDQVTLTTQPMELMPMKASERRVVHMAVTQHGGVSSESIGEGEERRVVVKPS